MSTIFETAESLAEQWRTNDILGMRLSIADSMADLLRQIAALGDGEGLTRTQIDQIAEGIGLLDGYNTRFADALIDAATLPLKARIAELQKDKADLEAYIDLADDDRTKLQEQLAASQAREQGLLEYFDAKRALEHTYVDEDASRHECLEAQARAVLAEMVVLQRKDGGDYDALHADRKATIELVRDSLPKHDWINAEKIRCALTEAAERAGRGEEI